MSKIRRYRAASLLLWLVSCSPAAREVKPAGAYGEAPPLEHGEEAPSSEAQLVPITQMPPQAMPPLLSPEPIAQPEPVFPWHLPEISAFYAALEQLVTSERETPVRILWWGDSHTAADFLTDPIRQHLDKQTKSGGPGFVRLGLSGYRHGAVRLTADGTWRKAPILPAQRTQVLDGVFGIGGIRTLPAAGARASAELREPTDAAMRWTLSYRLPEGAQLEVKLGTQVERLRSERETISQIRSSSWEAPGTATFSVRHIAGDPQVMGAFVESVEPGVVFDTIGINGARVATILAWESEQLIQQIALRDPELLVLAFGTNEVFDNTKVNQYEEHIALVVELARKAKPGLACWIVGPPDSASISGGSKERVSEVTDVQRTAAKTHGCAFSSQYELMGGEGSFKRWIDMRPTRARTDRIHLSIAGYQVLGEMLSQELLPTQATQLAQ